METFAQKINLSLWNISAISAFMLGSFDILLTGKTGLSKSNSMSKRNNSWWRRWLAFVGLSFRTLTPDCLFSSLAESYE
ncbi:hypothetical protein [Celeribacter sp. HF31]|uniref:hypothetical protein n=1 Tax=Celeribacter sp. HF31 TaxID=2721558 RepID=UPI0014320E48|nr:hypothetical protein [Celeribacter sp. HF31]